MALATNSIQNLFDNVANPTRLVQPSGGVSIADAISTADSNLNQLKLMNSNSYNNDVLYLSQLLGFAKGLLMLQPYFTDLTMTAPSAQGQLGTGLSATNSSINQIGISNVGYMQILNNLMASLGNGGQSIVFILNESRE